MAVTGPPGPGWYANPLGPAGVRWWDGASWTDPAEVPQLTPGPRLPRWAKTCFAFGIAVGIANLLFITLIVFVLALSSVLVDGFRDIGPAAELWVFAAVGLVAASAAAAGRGETRLRVSALIAAIAVMAGGWVWYRTTLPPRPQPTLAELKKSPAAQLIYPGAVVAAQLTRGHESLWASDSPVPADFGRDEATNDSWPQVLAWFDRRLTADGWTRTGPTSVNSSDTIALAWSWTNGTETFTLSVYSEAGRDALSKQAPELRGRAIALGTYLY
jgi:hypothetical protein